MRRVSGYNLDELIKPGPFNLAKILVGSEGTLATITEAKVRICRYQSRPARSVQMPPVKASS